MRGKPGAGGLGVGGSSILVIFVLLSLTTFAALAMVSASAGYRMANRVVAASDAYYAADSHAEEILAVISREIRSMPDTYSPSRVDELIYNNIFMMSPDVRIGQTSPGFGMISFTVPIDEVKHIQVKLEIDYSRRDLPLRIVAWNVVAEEFPEFGDYSRAVWVGD